MAAPTSQMQLCPIPRRIELTSERFVVAEIRVRWVNDLPPQGYRLSIGHDGTNIDARDAAGEHYARLTLAQLGSPAPGGLIEDWPDLAVRAVMLDVSRDRVPTMATLELLVDQLARWKVNQLQLYFEHTFAYADHESVWHSASPFTSGEIAELDLYCAHRHIELVPNQNCLGHAERWLRHARYTSLSLRPEGFDIMGLHRGPTTLDPSNPAAFAFIASLLDELVPNFSSMRVHIGMDEPWELPAERITDYVAWMQRLCSLPVLRDREVLVWGDILAHHPDVLQSLPDNVIVAEWGYEADHPFSDRARALADAGRSMWLCPGTSSWQSLLGRFTNMRANTVAASSAALDHDATGLMITDWGDWGHHQPAAVSTPAYAYGAAVSWCAASNVDIDVSGVTDAAAVALGDVYLATAAQRSNCSSLVRHLYLPQARVRHITIDELDNARQLVNDGIALLADRADDDRRDDADELRWAADVVRLGLDDASARLAGDGTLASIGAAKRAGFADRTNDIANRHGDLWLRRSRPGGLVGSRRWFERLREGYQNGMVPDQWPYPEVDLSDGSAS